MKPETIVLVDGHALAYRSYFAIKPLNNSQGEPLNAVFGFLKTITSLLRDPKNCVVVTFDTPKKTFRHEQYEHYKAGRAEIPEDLPQQLRRIYQALDVLDVKHLDFEGFEADDIIGTLTKKAEREGFEVRILTSDRDSYQLIGDKVKVIRSDWSLMDSAGIEAKYGVTVAQWVDFRALIGDASDNIPGAKGVGEKTAAKFLQEFKTLEGVFTSAEQGFLKPPRFNELILKEKENVLFSRSLSQMVLDLELDVDFGQCYIRSPKAAEAQELFTTLEFRSILKELALEQKETVEVSLEWQDPPETAVWAFAVSKPNDTHAELKALAYIVDKAYVSVQPEYSSLTPTITSANAKNLATLARLHGTKTTPEHDPLLMAYVLDPNITEPEQVSQRYLQLDWSADVAAQASLTRKLIAELPTHFSPEQSHVYHNIELPLSRVLCDMEVTGVCLDVPFLKAFSGSLDVQLKNLEAQMHTLSGKVFNVNSRDQLEIILYDDLQLDSKKKTKLTGKRSTAASVLEEMRGLHPMVEVLLNYRELAKLKGTYLDPLPSLINPKTGRLHSTFAQTVAVTGRLSSLNPNLQNIPVRSELGREVRKAFVAPSGYKILAADYSQIELRLMAHCANDEKMITTFNEGADIHRRTAAQIMGMMEELVSPEQRRIAKTVNFGVLYGMSAHRLTGQLGISHSEAKAFIDGYFALYPKIKEWIAQTLQEGKKKGYVQTLLGRRRYVHELHTKNKIALEAAERAAYNMPIQGTAADIIKLAMLKLPEALQHTGAKMVLQVHDELLFEVPEAEVDTVAQIVKNTMQNAMQLKVPLEVGIGVGSSWYEAK